MHHADLSTVTGSVGSTEPGRQMLDLELLPGAGAIITCLTSAQN